MSDVPDLYTDQVSFAQTPFGIALTFSLSPSNPSPIGQTPAETKVVVRMSLEHAKVMAMVLRKTLKQYELEHLGDPINVPKKVLDASNLDPSDW
jgi:hypothetical protein